MTNGDAVPVFTTKDMLVRMDGKLDVIASKQSHYDVELALLRARVEVAETDIEEKLTNGEKWREEVRDRIDAISQEQANIGSRQKATAIVVAGVVIASNILLPFLLRWV